MKSWQTITMTTILYLSMCKIIKGSIFFLWKCIYFSFTLMKNKILKMQETTNWCFQSKCKQKHTEIYLVNWTCRYQTSEAERTGLTGSLMRPAALSPPPWKLLGLIWVQNSVPPLLAKCFDTSICYHNLCSQLECFDTWRWQYAHKRTDILQEQDGVIKFLFFKDWHVVAFPLTFVRAGQIGITSWQSTISNMIK